jgi:hypothetical protein
VSISEPSSVCTCVEEFTLEQISKGDKATLATGSFDHSYLKVRHAKWPYRLLQSSD